MSKTSRSSYPLVSKIDLDPQPIIDSEEVTPEEWRVLDAMCFREDRIRLGMEISAAALQDGFEMRLDDVRDFLGNPAISNCTIKEWAELEERDHARDKAEVSGLCVGCGAHRLPRGSMFCVPCRTEFPDDAGVAALRREE